LKSDLADLLINSNIQTLFMASIATEQLV